MHVCAAEVAKWEYQDPKGNVQGLFTSKLMLTWADKGQLPTDLQVISGMISVVRVYTSHMLHAMPS